MSPMLSPTPSHVVALDDAGAALVRWEARACWQRSVRLTAAADGFVLPREIADLLALWLVECGPTVALTLRVGAHPDDLRLHLDLQLSTMGVSPKAAQAALGEAARDLSHALLLGGATGPWDPAPAAAPAGPGTRALVRDPAQPMPEMPGHGIAPVMSDRMTDLLGLLALHPGPVVATTLRARPASPGLGAAVSAVDQVAGDPRGRTLHDLPDRSWRLVEHARLAALPALDARIALLSDRPPSPLLRAIAREALAGPAPHLLTWRAVTPDQRAALAVGGHQAVAAVRMGDDLPGPWRGDAAAGLLRAVGLGADEADGDGDAAALVR